MDVDADIDALIEGGLNIIEEPAVSDDDNQEMVLEKNDKLNLMDAQLEKERQKYEKEKNVNNDKWVKQVYTKLNSDEKRQFREALITAAPEMKRGKVSQLRKTGELNFSNPPANSEQI